MISIHALLAESDVMYALKLANAMLFLSTLSLRRATNGHEQAPYRVVISIHALLAESDAIDVFLAVWAIISIHALLAESDESQQLSERPTTYFYPRSPCGERQRT